MLPGAAVYTTQLYAAMDADSKMEAAAKPSPTPMQHKYLCAQCGKVHALSRRDTVRCGDCGYRIMYKLRDEGARYMCVAR